MLRVKAIGKDLGKTSQISRLGSTNMEVGGTVGLTSSWLAVG
jgi:hypothetical protein